MSPELEQCPRSLLVCEKGNFKNEKSRHESQALKHSFNCRISLLIPECGRLPVMLEKVLSNFSSYFHVQDFPVSTFLEEKWLDAVKKGGFYALSSKTRIDEDNVVAVLPSGQLILSLDKDTYEQLGLEGRPSQYSHRKTVRHIVTVDLKSLVLGTKKYQRVLLCLKERVPLKTDFLFTGGAVSLLDLLSKQLYEECRPALHCRTLQDLLCPSLIPSDLKGESGSVTPTQFLEWLGAVSLSISCDNQATSFLSTYACPEPQSSVSQALLCTVTGLISPQDVCKLLTEIRRYLDEPKLTSWVSLTVHGCADSPVSWGSAEHGFHKGGENFYNFVCFQNQDYWLHMATGAKDACPP
ncbi:ribonuclease P protein subunit p40 isoform X2 [Astyanax mexicanus]|uniref:ribonuclease P protein subunit p40 isoform X2 n=1 Tax=Astyanax mexicanus TaxID=7994 RepID=UPI000BBD79C5|nr:ribonuclease P protein subunit p40 isoform X2 [Astyanax mexicanus]